MSKFVDIHGQNGTQSLLNKDFYLDLIDSFDKEETFKIKTELREILNIAEYKKHTRVLILQMKKKIDNLILLIIKLMKYHK